MPETAYDKRREAGHGPAGKRTHGETHEDITEEMFPHEYSAESDKNAPYADAGGVRAVAAAPVLAKSQR